VKDDPQTEPSMQMTPATRRSCQPLRDRTLREAERDGRDLQPTTIRATRLLLMLRSASQATGHQGKLLTHLGAPLPCRQTGKLQGSRAGWSAPRLIPVATISTSLILKSKIGEPKQAFLSIRAQTRSCCRICCKFVDAPMGARREEPVISREGGSEPGLAS